MNSILEERRNALEEAFFDQQDRALREQFQAKQEREAQLDTMAEGSGISDREVLGALIDLGVSAETLAALGLVPLVEMAWVDGTLESSESRAIQQAAAEAGITAETAAGRLLDGWLSSRPGPELLEAWKGYASALGEALTPEQLAAVRGDVLGRARDVAKAAGGFLGLKSVAQSELDLLDELEKAFG